MDKIKLLFGFRDVLLIDAWLDHFDEKGFEVDGAMSGEDLLGTAGKIYSRFFSSRISVKRRD